MKVSFSILWYHLFPTIFMKLSIFPLDGFS
nr:MAG TPA: hypothetical protein [Caudoviricetes sp.]